MGLDCLFSTPNSSPFLSAQNAFVILLSVSEEEALGDSLVQESAESGKTAAGKCRKKQCPC